jgi:hypothetical protein
MVRSVDDVANKSPAGANEMSLMTYGFGAPNRPFPNRIAALAQGPAARLSCRPHAAHVSVYAYVAVPA